jgi:uncharacterized SAM-binding protein YcdF (DUF218 family)
VGETGKGVIRNIKKTSFMGSIGSVRLVIILMIPLLFNSCTFSRKTCLRMLEDSMKNPYDIVIVPGVPFEDTTWSWTMKGRVYWSKYLYDEGISKNVMYSGSAVYTPYIEGKIMALYAIALGIPEENVFSETLAEHSTENVYYSYKMARKLGFKRIALATDQFQAKMLKRFTKKIVSRDAGIIPIVIDTLEALHPSMIDPKIDYQKAFVKDFIPLTERENFWKRFRGTRGLDIDTMVYR